MNTPETRLSLRFEQVVRDYPHRTAVSFGDATLTYLELNQRANVVADWMIAQGIGPERRVGVCLKPGFEIIITLLAIQKAGGVYLPISPEYPIARIERIFNDAKPDLTVSQSELIESLEEVLIQPVTLEQISACSNSLGIDNPEIATTSQNTAYIFYTSGTTGVPKGIAISQQGLSFYIHSAQQQFGIGAEDTVLTIAKYSFSISLFDLLTCTTTGGHLVILTREEIMDFSTMVAALKRATVVHIGPNLLKGLIHYILRNYSSYTQFAGLRHVSSGGDFVPAELLENLKTIFSKAEIYVIYGCTEIACMGCYYLIPRERRVDTSYIGKPFPPTEVILVQEDGQIARTEEAGEICFSGPGIMTGYLNRPELTEAAFLRIGETDYFRTGDLGRIDQTGNLEYLGRRDFQIKLRGQRIELLEIESILRQAPGVRDAIVTAAEINGKEKRLIAYITGEDPSTFALAPVRSFLQKQLPEYMQPSGWIVLDKMPLNENFKISRRALPPPTLGNLIVTENYVAPRTDAERTLTTIWEDVLNIPAVGVFDDFRSIGGDSLMAMYVCMLANEQNINISPLDFAKKLTVAELLEETSDSSSLRVCSVPDVETTGYLAGFPPFILHFLTARGEQPSDRWNVSRILVAAKRLSHKSLERAFRHLGERHDALKLTITREAGTWKGIVVDTPEKTLAFRTVELSGLCPAEKEKAMRETAADCQKNINLGHGPIAHMILFDSGENEAQELYFVIHHLMMDVISWKNFWFEFERTYLTLEAGGRPSTSVPAVSFGSWTHTLQQIASSHATAANVEKWLHQDWQATTEIPRDFKNDWTANTNGSVGVVTSSLSEWETQALLRVGSYGVDLQTVLNAALANSLSNWQKNNVVFFDRLVHGRNVALQGYELSRTIGCLVSYAPTLLTIDSSLPVSVLISDVATQMNTVDELSTSTELYRYYGLNEKTLIKTAQLPQAKVLLNYRGNIDAVFDQSSLFSKAYHFANLDHDPDGLRRYAIAISADLVEGKLTIRWVFSTRLHRKETIESLGHEFRQFIVSVVNSELPTERIASDDQTHQLGSSVTA
jgi:amino acid adenylation domain-containing protein/non-ribosomal peptide synthase protein (TIGR01720 family)